MLRTTKIILILISIIGLSVLSGCVDSQYLNQSTVEGVKITEQDIFINQNMTYQGYITMPVRSDGQKATTYVALLKVRDQQNNVSCYIGRNGIDGMSCVKDET